MLKDQLSAWEKWILLIVAVITGIGLVLFFSSVSQFERYVQEDGIVEWITVIGLLLSSFVCFERLFRLWRKKSAWFLVVTAFLGLFLFFAAGEEISWGQRLLGIESSEYFQKNNAQGETNLHNLVVNGVKINKLVFTLFLGVAIGVFLVIIPLLHRKNASFRRFIDYSGIPVTKFYQVVAIIVLAGLTSLITHGKNAELLESGAVLLFFLIIRYPKNQYVF